MPVRFFTVAFDPKQEVFQDEHLSKFLVNKEVNFLRAEFFQSNGKAYWTVFVDYEPVLREQNARGLDALDEPQRLLFKRLKQWRRTHADEKGIPAYMIATDNELIAIVQRVPRSLEALKQIRGFGKKKSARYGQAIDETHWTSVRTGDSIRAFAAFRPPCQTGLRHDGGSL